MIGQWPNVSVDSVSVPITNEASEDEEGEDDVEEEEDEVADEGEPIESDIDRINRR